MCARAVRGAYRARHDRGLAYCRCRSIALGHASARRAGVTLRHDRRGLNHHEIRGVAVRILLDVCGIVAYEQELALAPEVGHDIEDSLKQQHGACARSLLQVHKSIVQGQNEDKDEGTMVYAYLQS
jgi:hypothetical protein